MKKKTITKEIEIINAYDLPEDIDAFIKIFQEIKYKHCGLAPLVNLRPSYDKLEVHIAVDNYSTEFKIQGTRKETDAELEKRRERSEKAKIAAEKRKKNKQEEIKKEYERLQKILKREGLI